MDMTNSAFNDRSGDSATVVTAKITKRTQTQPRPTVMNMTIGTSNDRSGGSATVITAKITKRTQIQVRPTVMEMTIGAFNDRSGGSATAGDANTAKTNPISAVADSDDYDDWRVHRSIRRFDAGHRCENYETNPDLGLGNGNINGE
jgi:hypothetical protein